jgi:hypothetical protein
LAEDSVQHATVEAETLHRVASNSEPVALLEPPASPTCDRPEAIVVVLEAAQQQVTGLDLEGRRSIVR